MLSAGLLKTFVNYLLDTVWTLFLPTFFFSLNLQVYENQLQFVPNYLKFELNLPKDLHTSQTLQKIPINNATCSERTRNKIDCFFFFCSTAFSSKTHTCTETSFFFKYLSYSFCTAHKTSVEK